MSLSFEQFLPLLIALLVAPHLLVRLHLSPVAGIGLWLSVLGLRAVVVGAGVVITLLYVPTTELFHLLTQWCLHAVVPFFATHLGLEGHRLGDAASLLPAFAVAASVLCALFGALRAAIRVGRWVRRAAVGPGPDDSLIIGGSELVVAAAGLRKPQVVISAGALLALDDQELAAGLQHERGHVERRHRFILLLSVPLLAISRVLPGARHAFRDLRFHLERDADEYAVRRTGDPLALASAICKVAGAGPARPAFAAPAVAALGGSDARDRLGHLLSQQRADRRSLTGTLAAWGLAAAAIAATVAIVAGAPELAHAGAQHARAAGEHLHGCV